MIELTEEQFDALVSAGSRPSPYEADVRNAVQGKGYAVVITESPSVKTIVNWLRKAERVTGRKIQVNVRESAVTKDSPLGLVVWTLAQPAPAVEPAE